MNAFTVAATITALDGADWLPPTLNWEIATTDGVWGAHCEIAADTVSEAYRLLCSIASAHGSEVGDDSRLLTVDFEHQGTPVRAWWLRPIQRWVTPEHCATCPTKLGDPAVSFVRLGVGPEAPVICVPCRDLMHARWMATGTAEQARQVVGSYRAEVLREAATALGEARRMGHLLLVSEEEFLEQLADEAGKVTPTGGEITQPAELTVYRAAYEHEQIPLGTYTNPAAARKHCTSQVRREHQDPSAVKLWWREDEDSVDQPEDGPAELWESVRPGHSRPTGYFVTPVTVASEYDEEADE